MEVIFFFYSLQAASANAEEGAGRSSERGLLCGRPARTCQVPEMSIRGDRQLHFHLGEKDGRRRRERAGDSARRAWPTHTADSPRARARLLRGRDRPASLRIEDYFKRIGGWMDQGGLGPAHHTEWGSRARSKLRGTDVWGLPVEQQAWSPCSAQHHGSS